MTVSAAQGRPRLHRPDLPRAGHRPARPQPRSVLVGESADRAPFRPRFARAPTSPSSKASWACSTVAAPPAKAPPRMSPGCWTPRWCWWSTPRAIDAPLPRWSTVSPATTPGVRVAGVVLNHVASPRHEQLLRESLAGPLTAHIPVIGAVPRDAVVQVPSRHLGLVPAQERGASATAPSTRSVLSMARHRRPRRLPGAGRYGRLR